MPLALALVKAFSDFAQPSRCALPLWLGQSAARTTNDATKADRAINENFRMAGTFLVDCLSGEFETTQAPVKYISAHARAENQVNHIGIRNIAVILGYGGS